MHLPIIFRLTRWTIAAFVMAAVTAMSLYPGGTYVDRSTTGYRFFENFLSDLGMATAWGRQANPVGAPLFVASEIVMAVVLIVFFAALVGLHSSQRASRQWARAGGTAGVLAGAAFMAAALLPADRFLALHVQAAVWAFRMILLTVLLFAIACARDRRFSRRAAIVWFALTIVLTLQVVMLQWGPRLTSVGSLILQVTTQKISVGALLAAVAYLSGAVERAAAERL